MAARKQEITNEQIEEFIRKQGLGVLAEEDRATLAAIRGVPESKLDRGHRKLSDQELVILLGARYADALRADDAYMLARMRLPTPVIVPKDQLDRMLETLVTRHLEVG